MAGKTFQTKAHQHILDELEKLVRAAGVKVSTGRLQYAGLKLKGGQCLLRLQPWLVVDRTLPFEEQVDIFRQTLAGLNVDESRVPDEVKPYLKVAA